MIKLLLQTTNLVQDVNFDKAINIEGSFKRVSTNKFPMSETLKAITSDNIQNIICTSDILNDFNAIQRIVVESRAFKKNIFLIVHKDDFDNVNTNTKSWLTSNADELNEIAQTNNEVTLKKVS